jgi:hypothetical protein
MDGTQQMDNHAPSKPRAGEFFLLEPDVRRGNPGHGVVFENLSRLLTPPRLILRPERGGFPPLRETPRLVYNPIKGIPPQDLEAGFSGYWLVSERLHRVMVSVDPAAFAFVEAEYRLDDGRRGPRYFLCDVVQEVDALDEAASELFIDTTEEFLNGKFYDLTGGASVTFNRDRLGSAHVFKTPYNGTVFCDRVFKDAVEATGIVSDQASNGLWFIDAADI